MDKVEISKEQYEEIRQNWRKEHGYDDATEEEKAKFDREFETASTELFDVVDEDSDSEESETTENWAEKKMMITYSELENAIQKKREKCGYEYMTSEQKELFDNELEKNINETFDVVDDEKEKDYIEENEDIKIKRLIR